MKSSSDVLSVSIDKLQDAIKTFIFTGFILVLPVSQASASYLAPQANVIKSQNFTGTKKLGFSDKENDDCVETCKLDAFLDDAVFALGKLHECLDLDYQEALAGNVHFTRSDLDNFKLINIELNTIVNHFRSFLSENNVDDKELLVVFEGLVDARYKSNQIASLIKQSLNVPKTYASKISEQSLVTLARNAREVEAKSSI